jgi:hypothetical protein
VRRLDLHHYLFIHVDRENPLGKIVKALRRTC